MKLPIILADVLAQTAQARARGLMRKALMGVIAGVLLAGGVIFFIAAGYMALARSIGGIDAALVFGGVFVVAGLGLLLWSRKRSDPLAVADPEHGKTVVRPASALSASLSKSDRVSKTPTEAAVEAAVTGNYAEAVGHASAVGRQLGKSVPPAALPIAGLAIGAAIAWAVKDRKD